MMGTANSVIAQLQSELDRANAATGMPAATIHDAITALISGYGSSDSGSSSSIRHSGTVTYSYNCAEVYHNCGSSKYMFIAHASGVPEESEDVWRAISIIGLYDANGISFNGSTYNTVAAGVRYKAGSRAAVVYCSNKSTDDLFKFDGNSFPQNIECSWELYDLSGV